MNSNEGLILPISYFPPISYFSCLASGHKIILETGETFPKQTLRNRCEISDSTGKHILIVPVTKPHGNHTKTFEVLVSSHEDWQKNHWRTLQTAYSSSPFFLYYSDIIREMISSSAPSLLNLDLHIIEKISSLIGLKLKYSISNDFLKEAGDKLDLRNAFSKKKHHWSGSFTAYPQVFSHKTGFIENLSILDLVFNLGPESLDYLKETTRIIPTPSG